MNDLSRRILTPPMEPEDTPRPRGHRTGPFGVLDIGSTKIACLIGRTESDGSLRVLGFGWHRGRGVRGGAIVDLDEAERAIRACVGQAEDMADTRLSKVAVNLSCGSPASQLLNVQYPIEGRAIEESDLRKVVAEGQARGMAEGREIIHTLALGFAVDEMQGVPDPRGLHCQTLTARLHVVDALGTALQNLRLCVGRCDLGVGEIVSAPFAAGLATLVPDERDLGAVVIDMGGGTTGMAVFVEGQLQHTAQIMVGGNHVTNDLARVLTTTVSHAERLKTLYGNTQTSPDDDREQLPVPQIGEDEHQISKVPRSMIINIIRPRLEETFELVKQRLEQSGLERSAGTRVVLTGGASQLAGMRELAAHVLGRQVRIGRPQGLRGLPDSASGPAFATAGGLLHWAAGHGRVLHELETPLDRPNGLFRRIARFLKERV